MRLFQNSITATYNSPLAVVAPVPWDIEVHQMPVWPLQRIISPFPS